MTSNYPSGTEPSGALPTVCIEHTVIPLLMPNIITFLLASFPFIYSVPRTSLGSPVNFASREKQLLCSVESIKKDRGEWGRIEVLKSHARLRRSYHCCWENKRNLEPNRKFFLQCRNVNFAFSCLIKGKFADKREYLKMHCRLLSLEWNLLIIKSKF